jgi:hypothetical protein
MNIKFILLRRHLTIIINSVETLSSGHDSNLLQSDITFAESRGGDSARTENGIPTDPFIIECSSCDFNNINFEREAGSKVSKYALDNGIGLSVGIQYNF